MNTGRVIAARRNKGWFKKGHKKIPGSGPKAGQRNALGYGELSTIELARMVCNKIGDRDPAFVELMAMVCGIARGDPGLRGRHVGDKYRAIREVLDRLKGKPVQPLEHTASSSLEKLILEALTTKPDE